MKRTVRAWVALHRECGEPYEIDLTSDYYGTFVIGRARQQVTGEGARVVRCTITYDDGKPRKPARKGYKRSYIDACLPRSAARKGK